MNSKNKLTVKFNENEVDIQFKYFTKVIEKQTNLNLTKSQVI